MALQARWNTSVHLLGGNHHFRKTLTIDARRAAKTTRPLQKTVSLVASTCTLLKGGPSRCDTQPMRVQSRVPRPKGMRFGWVVSEQSTSQVSIRGVPLEETNPAHPASDEQAGGRIHHKKYKHFLVEKF